MRITILTLFPEMFKGPLSESIVKRAIEKKYLEISLINIRDFGVGRHKIVDDKPYGGGVGMVLRVDVLHKAIESVLDKNLSEDEQKVVLMDARGQKFTQKKAVEFSKTKHLILVCGHYEGFDERILQFVNEQISIGDFIVTGGEIPAMLISDAVIRLIPGVLKEAATHNESFTNEEILEHPQYTRPDGYQGHIVPDILKSGDHKKITDWKKQNSSRITVSKD